MRFEIAVNAVPTIELEVRLQADRVDCEFPDAVLPSGSGVTFVPSTFTFFPDSPAVTAGFYVRSSLIGCYIMHASTPTASNQRRLQETYLPASASVTIQRRDQPLSPPYLTSQVKLLCR